MKKWLALLCAVLLLFLLGPGAFLAPALAVTALILTVFDITVRKGAGK